MFPNDDICNVKSAKSAARRIFQKYTLNSSQHQQGLGHQQVSGLIKNAYSAINMDYDPSSSDVSSFMSIFGVGQHGCIQLNKLQQLAIKYLCGQEALKVEKINPQETNIEKETIIPKLQECDSKLRLLKSSPQIFPDKKNGKKLKDNSKRPYSYMEQGHHTRNVGFNFVSSKVTERQNFFLSKQNSVQGTKISTKEDQKVPKKLINCQILNQANEIFNRHKNQEKQGITVREASQVLKKSYRLVGKTKFSLNQQDVRVWMKLCDLKRNGVIEWASYENFIKDFALLKLNQPIQTATQPKCTGNFKNHNDIQDLMDPKQFCNQLMQSLSQNIWLIVIEI